MESLTATMVGFRISDNMFIAKVLLHTAQQELYRTETRKKEARQSTKNWMVKDQKLPQGREGKYHL